VELVVAFFAVGFEVRAFRGFEPLVVAGFCRDARFLVGALRTARLVAGVGRGRWIVFTGSAPLH